MNFRKLFLLANSLIVAISITIPAYLHASNQTELWLVRHGQTDWNIQKRYIGQANVPLNQLGMHQAKLASQFLLEHHQLHPFTAIYSSDLSRASTTAQAIASQINLPVTEEKKLREIHDGIIEGLNAEEIHKKFPNLLEQRESNHEFAIPKGESLQQVTNRLIVSLKELINKYIGKRVILVTHHGCLNLINRWIKENFPQENHPHVDPENASISLVVIENNYWKIAWWGKADHLTNALH